MINMNALQTSTASMVAHGNAFVTGTMPPIPIASIVMPKEG